MNNKDFQKLMLKTAILSMSADGNIHKEEIKKFSELIYKSKYFKDIDLENELKLILEDIDKNFMSAFENYINFFDNNYLSVNEVLLLFELLLDVINSDFIITDEEVFFIKTLRSKFKYIPNEIFISRFGYSEYFNIETENPFITLKKPNFNDIDFSSFLDGEVKNLKDND